MILAAFLAAAAVQPAQPAPAAEPAYEALSFERALEIFRQICVTPLPSPEAFVAAMNGIGVRWRKQDRTPQEVFAIGNGWSSELGEVRYGYRGSGMPSLPPGPACHFTFRTDGAYDHTAATARLAAALALPQGRVMRDSRGPQMRWETIWPAELQIRLFLTSNFEVPGPRSATLSISRRHPNPFRPGEAAE